MSSIEKALFPGIAAGCLFLVFVVGLIANPTIALASAPEPTMSAQQPTPTAVQAEKQPAKEQASPAQAGAEKDSGGCSLSQNFPDSIRQWCGLIERYAQQNNLDPTLLAAVMLQESGGNPRAYSKSGAVGLLQVMPKDGLASSFMCVNGPCFSSRPSTEELYDPEFNISYGARMLADLVQKTGDIREALLAYGPIGMGYRYADIIISIASRYR